MAQLITTICVFVASPSDCVEEREAVRQVVAEVKEDVAEPLGVRIECIGWEDENPGPGRPQDQINEQLDLADWVVFVLGERFGTPTGGYRSGFEEEFVRARERYRQTGSPRMALFFHVLPAEWTVSKEQQTANLAFRDEVFRSQEFLAQVFEDLEQFRRQLRKAFSHWLIRREYVVVDAAAPPRSSPRLEVTDEGGAAFHRAKQQLREGRPASAERLLRDLLKTAPDSSKVWDALSAALKMQEQYEAALDAATRAVELAPEDYSPVYNRGVLRLDVGDLEGALEDFLKSVELRPGWEWSLGNVGAAYMNLGDAEDSLEWFNRAIEVEPNSVISLRNRAGALATLGRHAEALPDVNRAIELAADDAELRTQKARLLTKLEDYDGALDELQAIPREQWDVDHFRLKVIILGEARRPEQAIAFATEALEQFPADAEILRNRGVYQFYLNHIEESLSDLRTVAAETDWDSDWLNVACAEIVGNDPKAAFSAIERAKRASRRTENGLSVTWFEVAAAAVAGYTGPARVTLRQLVTALQDADELTPAGRVYSDMYGAIGLRAPRSIAEGLRVTAEVLAGNQAVTALGDIPLD